MPSWIPRLNYEIVLDSRRITFTDGDVRVELEPRIWVSDDGRLVEVGAYRPPAGARPIELFEPAAPDDPSRFDALVKLFRHVFKVMQDRSLFRIRPWVRVRGVAALRPLLNGYEEEVVRHALLQSGAVNVEFVA